MREYIFENLKWVQPKPVGALIIFEQAYLHITLVNEAFMKSLIFPRFYYFFLRFFNRIHSNIPCLIVALILRFRSRRKDDYTWTWYRLGLAGKRVYLKQKNGRTRSKMCWGLFSFVEIKAIIFLYPSLILTRKTRSTNHGIVYCLWRSGCPYN